MDTVTLTARVYKAPNLGGVDSTPHVWDFGVVVCIGNENVPYRQLDNLDLVGSAFADRPLDTKWKTEEDYDEREVTIYEYDYGMYCETVPNEPSYVAFDGDVWHIDNRVEHPEDNDDEVLDLVMCDLRGETRSMWQSQLDDRIADGEAVPLLNLG